MALSWPTESTFEYRAYRPPQIESSPCLNFAGLHSANTSEMPPLTDISIRRSLSGTSQADAQFMLIVTNNLPVEVRTGYLEAMPWHLQFYLHTLSAHVDGVLRGEFISFRNASPNYYATPIPPRTRLTR